MCFRHNQNPKYISYALSLNTSKQQKKRYASKGVAVYIKSKDIKKIKIPLPPLEIQKQIVQVLDAFRELVRKLINRLKIELKLRKKQYEYYLNKLISDVIEKGWGEYKTLGEIATEIYRGNGITKSQLDKGDFPCIHYGEIYNIHKIWFNKCISFTDEKLIKNPKYCDHGDLLITGAGENIKDISKACAYIGKEKAIAGGNLMIFKHLQNPKYLSYALSTNAVQIQKQKYAKEGVLVSISTNDLKKIKIPLPPLEIQEQIVNALDHLREICEDLEKGIPKEIKLANKRYEYYRDFLITGKN
ncbi:putative type-1 restriction enzyme specificity protein MPN_089 [Candidatus Mycoplasma haematohominis]|uniref:Putative type-1 restriction enzyme specificity protein MPN_089 n=1 Tax=Candidatus Mycoplasma haematohominis TaxID=1494318 RepID=A0A478FS92_9MOLU|nr:putative type-1 restriction enzyme specificity protein MPN_089 [Candidatus Mycoplasma haemohominis]